jgi:hypothetical protein
MPKLYQQRQDAKAFPKAGQHLPIKRSKRSARREKRIEMRF